MLGRKSLLIKNVQNMMINSFLKEEDHASN